MNRKLSALLLTSLLCLGCLKIESPNPGPSPGPGPSPVPNTALRKDVADSLSDVPPEECRKLGGVFQSMSEYVEAGSPDVTSTAQLFALCSKTLDNMSWSKGKYKKTIDVVGGELNNKFKTPKPINDVRDDVSETFLEIAAGCFDAAAR